LLDLGRDGYGTNISIEDVQPQGTRCFFGNAIICPSAPLAHSSTTASSHHPNRGPASPSTLGRISTIPGRVVGSETEEARTVVYVYVSQVRHRAFREPNVFGCSIEVERLNLNGYCTKNLAICGRAKPSTAQASLQRVDALCQRCQGLSARDNAVANYVEGAAGQVSDSTSGASRRMCRFERCEGSRRPCRLGIVTRQRLIRISAAASEALRAAQRGRSEAQVCIRIGVHRRWTKGIEMVSGYRHRRPIRRFRFRWQTALNEPLNTRDTGGRKELPSKRVWICTATLFKFRWLDDPSPYPFERLLA